MYTSTTEIYTLSLHDALPILVSVPWLFQVLPPTSTNEVGPGALSVRSEERRVGKECGSGGAAQEEEKNREMVTAEAATREQARKRRERQGRKRRLRRGE